VKIIDIRLVQVEGECPVSEGYSVARQVGALDLYPEYRARDVATLTEEEIAGSQPIREVYVMIDTDEGITGNFGPIAVDQAFQIDTRLRQHLIGQDPLATERLWDVMMRHDRHARQGYMMMAISAVDIALWDIRGKAAGLPVYRLLGGPTRERVPAYASCLGMSLDPVQVRAKARALKDEGFVAQKWFFRYGPSSGRGAIEKNLELVRTLREAVGDDVDLMFDAWLGWDIPFAVEMGQRMRPYHPRWLEEPVQPDHVASYAQIRRESGVPIAGGEHVYTRWGFKVLLDAEGVDVVQADPDWAGGISEMVKIIALSSAYDRPVIPHGHSVVPALHLVASQSPAVCPWLEYLLLHATRKQWFHQDKFMPKGGSVRLPSKPGLSIELDMNVVQRLTALCWR